MHFPLTFSSIRIFLQFQGLLTLSCVAIWVSGIHPPGWAHASRSVCAAAYSPYGLFHPYTCLANYHPRFPIFPWTSISCKTAISHIPAPMGCTPALMPIPQLVARSWVHQATTSTAPLENAVANQTWMVSLHCIDIPRCYAREGVWTSTPPKFLSSVTASASLWELDIRLNRLSIVGFVNHAIFLCYTIAPQLWWMWISPLFGTKRSGANVARGTGNGSTRRLSSNQMARMEWRHHGPDAETVEYGAWSLQDGCEILSGFASCRPWEQLPESHSHRQN